MMMTRQEIFEEIELERDRQDAKWGDQSGHALVMWSAILTEEVGEAAQAALQSGPYAPANAASRTDHLRKELIQVAAVAVAWLEGLTLAHTSATGGES